MPVEDKEGGREEETKEGGKASSLEKTVCLVKSRWKCITVLSRIPGATAPQEIRKQLSSCLGDESVLNKMRRKTSATW